MCIAFVEKSGTVEIKGKIVHIAYRSETDVFLRAIPLDEFRAFIAHGTAKLHEFDAAERAQVVPLRKKREPKHV
jgi:hypothetical protein